MNAREIVAARGGQWYGRYGLALCPAHDDGKTPALSVCDGERGPLAHCFGGCSQAAVIAALRSLGLCSGAAEPAEPIDEAELLRRTREREAEDLRRREAALAIWHGSQPIAGTIGETYLRNRCVTIELPVSLRYRAALKHTGTGLHLPAMVAAIVGLDRRVSAIQRGYLAPTGRKAEVSGNKMALGRIGHGSVHLAPAGAHLGIAEGIETGLSAMQLFNVPVWCACGSWLSKVAVPMSVTTVIIFADRGPAGEQATERAVRVHRDAGRAVEVRFPSIGDDFNDELQARASAGRAA